MHTQTSMKALGAVSVRLIISEKYGKPSPLGIGNCDAVDRVLAPGVSWRPHAPCFSESVTENRYED